MKTLSDLCNHYQTDKGTEKVYWDQDPPHKYSLIYEKHLEELREKELNLLELGLFWRGENKHIRAVEKGPRSLYVWRDYFKFANIYGLDIIDGEKFSDGRIDVMKINATKENELSRLFDKCDSFDIIIDDASHIIEQTVLSFDLLYPKLKNGGLYFIEDIVDKRLDSELRKRNIDLQRFHMEDRFSGLVLIRKEECCGVQMKNETDEETARRGEGKFVCQNCKKEITYSI